MEGEAMCSVKKKSFARNRDSDWPREPNEEELLMEYAVGEYVVFVDTKTKQRR